MRQLFVRWTGWVLLVSALASVVGCASNPDAQTGGTPIARGLAPSFTDAARAYNLRIAGMESMWARCAVQIRYIDEGGEERQEQGEGSLAVVRPDRVALRVTKVGQLLFWGGSDQTRYWWIDLTSDQPRAWVGSNQSAQNNGRSGSGAATGGLQAYPPDIVRVLGVLPARVDPALPDGGAPRNGLTMDGCSV